MIAYQRWQPMTFSISFDQRTMGEGMLFVQAGTHTMLCAWWGEQVQKKNERLKTSCPATNTFDIVLFIFP